MSPVRIAVVLLAVATSVVFGVSLPDRFEMMSAMFPSPQSNQVVSGLAKKTAGDTIVPVKAEMYMFFGSSWFADTLGRIEYKYDFGARTSVMVTYMKGFGTTVWMPSFRYSYTYNASNMPVLMQTDNYNLVKNVWVNGSRLTSTYTYQNSNLSTMRIDELWDTLSQVWKVRTYFKDSCALLPGSNTLFSQAIVQSRTSTNDPWVNFSKYKFTYDAQNKRVEMVDSLWNAVANKWISSSKDKYTYDSQNRLIAIVDSSWNAATNRWKATSRILFTNDQNGVLVQQIMQNWDTAAIVPTWKNFFKTDNTNATFSTGIINPWSSTNSNALAHAGVFVWAGRQGITVKVADKSAAAIAIYDLHGRVVASQADGNGILHKVQPGSYIVTVSIGSERILRQACVVVGR